MRRAAAIAALLLVVSAGPAAAKDNPDKHKPPRITTVWCFQGPCPDGPKADR